MTNSNTNTVLNLAFDGCSEAEYTPPSNTISHMEELFCNFQSIFFTHYESDDSHTKYKFPFYTYGILDSFWKEQTGAPILNCYEEKNNLKIKWIYQLIQGLKQLHETKQYYGNLSSKCITIDDGLNVKYTYFDNPPDSTNTITNESSYYLPPEFYKQNDKKNSDHTNEKKDEDTLIEQNKKYDVYALGIIINGIVTEKFPEKSDFPKKNDETIKILKEQGKGDDDPYPKRDREDPLWKGLSSDIIDPCLSPNPDDRPSMSGLSELFDNFLKANEISTDSFENYNEEPKPILRSCIENDQVRVPSIITDSISYYDIGLALSYIEEERDDMSLFFKSDIISENPFNIGINQFCFHIMSKHFYPGFQGEEEEENSKTSEILLTTVVTCDENYSITDISDFNRMDDSISKSRINNKFYANSIPICTLSQLIDFTHQHQKSLFDSNDIYSWILYLAKYLELIEENENDQLNILPDNFSSNSVLISLLNVSKDINVSKEQSRFQLSVFPYKVEESEFSEIYNFDSDVINFNRDIYAFGVLMFHILGLYKTQDQQDKFQSKVMQDLYDKIHGIDKDFRYNVKQLEKATDFIEKCLTVGKQPSNFKEVLQTLEDLEINPNFNKSIFIKKRNYCLNNQNIKLPRLAFIADLLRNDSINDLVSFCTKTEFKNGGNPYANLLNCFVKSFESSLQDSQNSTINQQENYQDFDDDQQENYQDNDDDQQEEEQDFDHDQQEEEQDFGDDQQENYQNFDGQQENDQNQQKDDEQQFDVTVTSNDLFDFLVGLMRIYGGYIQIGQDVYEEESFIDFQLLKEKLLNAEAVYDEKCETLPPTPIDLQGLPICSVEFALSTIFRSLSQNIPHVLLISIDKPGYEYIDNDDIGVEGHSEHEDNGDYDEEYEEAEDETNESNNESSNENSNENNNENSNENNNENSNEDIIEEVVDKSQACTIEYLKKFLKARAKYFPCKMKWKQIDEYTLKVRISRGHSPIFQELKSLLKRSVESKSEFEKIMENIDDNYYINDDDDDEF